MNAPSAKAISGAEWERRFKARIVARLTAVGEGSQWTADEAQQVAKSEYEAIGPNDWADYGDIPEAAADEALSYWGEE